MIKTDYVAEALKCAERAGKREAWIEEWEAKGKPELANEARISREEWLNDSKFWLNLAGIKS
jgi:hypothetical protein